MSSAIATFKRYEKKFLVSEVQYNALLPILNKNMTPDSNGEKMGGYAISNIYFDTSDNSIIRHSISKPYFKEKLRLRCYGIPKDDDPAFLELKRKVGGLVTKRRARLTLCQAEQFLKTGEMPADSDYITRQVLDEILYFRGHAEIQPKVYIGYERDAFFTPDKALRVTFDRNILTRREDLLLKDGLYGEPLLKDGQRLIEVKFSQVVPLWLSRELSHLEIYKTSFSKYGKEYEKYLLSSSY